jgi:hypothetical protein
MTSKPINERTKNNSSSIESNAVNTTIVASIHTVCAWMKRSRRVVIDRTFGRRIKKPLVDGSAGRISAEVHTF